MLSDVAEKYLDMNEEGEDGEDEEEDEDLLAEEDEPDRHEK